MNEMAEFTLDGSPELEQHLAAACDRIRYAVQCTLPLSRLEGLVLGGGYGRGEGGVLGTPAGEKPYNDLEFYLFLRGNRLLNQVRYRKTVDALADELTAELGLHVEFKLDSLARLRSGPISMFSYDLVAGHRTVIGGSEILHGCEHHLRPETIPLSEATRLLFNRCSGLLLAKDLLRKEALESSEQDFIARNLAKAQLALGDAVLTAFGQYHWSGLERHRRLVHLVTSDPAPSLSVITAHHSRGLHFKLRPHFTFKTVAELREEHRQLASLALELWLWVESKRLRHPFASPEDYAASRVDKCPETARWRNCLLNLRTLGPRAALSPLCWRYPRERLLTSLPLLLWKTEATAPVHNPRLLQRALHTRASDWNGLVAAYKQIWAGYG